MRATVLNHSILIDSFDGQREQKVHSKFFHSPIFFMLIFYKFGVQFTQKFPNYFSFFQGRIHERKVIKQFLAVIQEIQFKNFSGV